MKDPMSEKTNDNVLFCALLLLFYVVKCSVRNTEGTKMMQPTTSFVAFSRMQAFSTSYNLLA